MDDYRSVNRGQTERLAGGEYGLAERPWRLAHSYTLQAVEPAS